MKNFKKFSKKCLVFDFLVVYIMGGFFPPLARRERK